MNQRVNTAEQSVQTLKSDMHISQLLGSNSDYEDWEYGRYNTLGSAGSTLAALKSSSTNTYHYYYVRLKNLIPVAYLDKVRYTLEHAQAPTVGRGVNAVILYFDSQEKYLRQSVTLSDLTDSNLVFEIAKKTNARYIALYYDSNSSLNGEIDSLLDIEPRIVANYTATSVMEQTAENIKLMVENTGIYITSGEINMHANKFTLLNDDGEETMGVDDDGNVAISGTLKAARYGYKIYFASQMHAQSSSSYNRVPADADYYYCMSGQTEVYLPYAGNVPGARVEIFVGEASNNLDLYADDDSSYIGNGRASLIILDGDHEQTSGTGFTIGNMVKVVAWADPSVGQWRILEMTY